MDPPRFDELEEILTEMFTAAVEFDCAAELLADLKQAVDRYCTAIEYRALMERIK